MPYFFGGVALGGVPLDSHDDIKDAPKGDMEPKSNEHRKKTKEYKTRAPKQRH